MTTTYRLVIDSVDMHERELAEDVAEFNGRVAHYFGHGPKGLPDVVLEFTTRADAEAYADHYAFPDEYEADDLKACIRETFFIPVAA